MGAVLADAVNLCGLLRVYPATLVEQTTRDWPGRLGAVEQIVRWHDGDGDPPKGVELPPMARLWRLRASLLRSATSDFAARPAGHLRLIRGGGQ